MKKTYDTAALQQTVQEILAYLEKVTGISSETILSGPGTRVLVPWRVLLVVHLKRIFTDLPKKVLTESIGIYGASWDYYLRLHGDYQSRAYDNDAQIAQYRLIDKELASRYQPVSISEKKLSDPARDFGKEADAMVATVCNRIGFEKQELLSDSKKAELVRARAVLAVLLKRIFPKASWTKIAEVFRHQHQMALLYVQKHEEKKAEDSDYRKLFLEMESRFITLANA